jgi:hypothetical protein
MYTENVSAGSEVRKQTGWHIAGRQATSRKACYIITLKQTGDRLTGGQEDLQHTGRKTGGSTK